MRPFITFVAGCCAIFAASQAHATLVINLRFNDTGTGGTQTMDVSGLSPGNTVVIQVWATVTGTNTTNTDDGFNSSFFGLLSNGATANLTGAITTGSAVSPFSFVHADGGQIGTFGDRNADGIGDWRGTSTTGDPDFPTPWPKAGHGTHQVMAGGPDGHANLADPAHAWDFHIVDAVFTISAMALPGTGTLNALTYDASVLGNLGLGNAGKANWMEEGVSKSGTATLPAAGTSVTFILTALPEPSSVALAGAGLVGIAGYAWRRRRMTTRDRA